MELHRRLLWSRLSWRLWLDVGRWLVRPVLWRDVGVVMVGVVLYRRVNKEWVRLLNYLQLGSAAATAS